MSFWQQFFAILGCGFLLWWLYRGIKNNPEAFTGQNLNKSFMTMGILALILIATISIAIMMLRR